MQSAPKQYMNINEFLDLFFAAYDNNDSRWQTFVNWLADNPRPDNNPKGPARIQTYIDDNQSVLSDKMVKLFSVFRDAWQDALGGEHSAEADDFINMMRSLTLVFSSWNNNCDFETQQVIRLVSNNKIKNPKYAYKLLRQASLREEQRVSKELKHETLRHMLASPFATSQDARRYCETSKSAEEVLAVINDYKVKTDEIIANVLQQDIINPNKMQDINQNWVHPLIYMSNDLKRLASGNQKMSEIAENISKTLLTEYSTDKMLSIDYGSYVQQYKDQAEIQIAKMKPDLEKAQQDLQKLQSKENFMRDALDKETAEVQKLRKQVNELEYKFNNSESKYNMLKATLNMHMAKANDRIANARGIDLTKGKDLANIFEQLGQDLQKQYK